MQRDATMKAAPGDTTAWGGRLDKAVAVLAALAPAGVVLGNAAFESAVALAVLLWLVRLAVTRHNPLAVFRVSGLVFPWALFTLAIVLSVVASGGGSKGAGHDLAFVRFFLFGAAVTDVSARRPVVALLVKGLALAVLLAAVNTASAWLFGWDLLGRPLERYTGKLKEASRIAALCAYAAPFFAAQGAGAGGLTKKGRSLWIGIGVLAFSLVLLTQVRTAILAAIAATLAAVALSHRKRLFTPWVTVPAGLFTAAALLLFFRYDLWDLASFYDRVYYWRVGLAIWADHPLLGASVSAFQETYLEIAASGRVEPFLAPNGEVYALKEQTHLHNVPLMVAACTGLFGLLASGWLFVRAALMALRAPLRIRAGLAAWPVVFLLAGLTGWNPFHAWYLALLSFFLVLTSVSAGGASGPGRNGHG
jgi:hypothetical protein